MGMAISFESGKRIKENFEMPELWSMMVFILLMA
jgi:hypothetical protein